MRKTSLRFASLLAVLTLSACGGKSDAEKAADASAAAEEAASASASSESAAAEEARRERLQEERAAWQECKRFTSDLLDALKQIDSRLDVGLNYDEYGDYLGDAQVAYDAVVDEIDKKHRDCAAAIGVPLESALNEYAQVYNVWGDCIGDYYCDFSTGAPNDKAQAGWLKAAGLIDRAERKLDQMEPPRT